MPFRTIKMRALAPEGRTACLENHYETRSTLPLHPPNQEKNNRKHNTNQDGTCERKIKSSVLAPVQEVPRQPAKRQACPPQQHNDAPDHYQGHAEYQQQPSHLRHASSLTPWVVKHLSKQFPIHARSYLRNE